jgi:hypothetical protein
VSLAGASNGAHGPRSWFSTTVEQIALATSIDRAPSGARWVHEIKFDGYRVQVHLREGAGSGGAPSIAIDSYGAPRPRHTPSTAPGGVAHCPNLTTVVGEAALGAGYDLERIGSEMVGRSGANRDPP